VSLLFKDKKPFEKRPYANPPDSWRKLGKEIATIRVTLAACQSFDNAATTLYALVEAINTDGSKKTLITRFYPYYDRPKSLAILDYLDSLFFKRWKKRGYTFPKYSIEIILHDISTYLMINRLMPHLRDKKEHYNIIEDIFNKFGVPVTVSLGDGSRQSAMINRLYHNYPESVKSTPTWEAMGKDFFAYYRSSLKNRERLNLL